MNDHEEYKAPVSHADLKKKVQKFLDASRENAVLARRDRDYFDGDQISAAVKHELAQRGQPPIYTNKIGNGIGGLLGIYDASISSPEALPRNSNSQGAADVATKTLRFLADKADYKRSRATNSKTFFVEGVCAAICQWAGKSATITPIKYEEFIYDPFSTDHDFQDAKWLGIAKLLDTTDVAHMFPNAPATAPVNPGDFGNFFDENSKKKWWGNTNQTRLVEMYYEINGVWHHAIFTDTALLHEGLSQYQDDEGESIQPIRATTYEIKRNGDRYGAVRHAVPLQDEVNARRSRLLHLTNHRQVQITDQFSAAVDKEIARREASKADGVMPFGYAPIMAPDMAQGQMMILQKADSDLDRMFPTPAVLGRLGSAGESGRSRQILQQAGYTELARSFSRLEALEASIYRLLWQIAKQYFDQPAWIRVTADPKAPEFLRINEPVMGPVMQPVTDPATGQPHIDPQTGQPAMQQAMGVTGYNNRLAELDLEIILTTVPDTASLQQEVYQTMLEVSKSTGVGPWDPRFAAVLEISTIPNKTEIIEKMAKYQQQQQPQDDGLAQAAAAAELQVKQAKAAKDGAQAQKTNAETALIAPSVMNQAYGHHLGPENYPQ